MTSLVQQLVSQYDSENEACRRGPEIIPPLIGLANVLKKFTPALKIPDGAGGQLTLMNIRSIGLYAKERRHNEVKKTASLRKKNGGGFLYQAACLCCSLRTTG